MTEKTDPFYHLCATEGFDLCHTFSTSWYNDRIEKEGLVASKQLETLPISSRAFLIGNTKAVWPLFCAWLLEQYLDELVDKTNYDENIMEQFVQRENLFDTFCEARLTIVVREYFQDQPYEVFWVHGGRQSFCGAAGGDKASSFLVCMQRVASISGLCWHDEEATKLCVHPEYGTWKSFRAVVVSLKEEDQRTISDRPPPAIACPVPRAELEEGKRRMQVAIQLSAADGSGVNYGKDNMVETGRSLCKYLHHSVCDGKYWSQISPAMRAWISLRDCISLGREDYKYSDPQLLYHYTKDPEILRNELKRLLSKGG